MQESSLTDLLVVGKVEHQRRVMSQVLSEPLGQLPSEGPWLHTGKNSRTSHSKVKSGLFREIYIPKTVWAVSEDERLHQNIGWLVFMGWVISQAKEWEAYYNYLGKEWNFHELGCYPHFGLYSQTQNCPMSHIHHEKCCAG